MTLAKKQKAKSLLKGSVRTVKTMKTTKDENKVKRTTRANSVTNYMYVTQV